MDHLYDALEKNAWHDDGQSESSKCAAATNEGDSTGQPTIAGDEAHASPHSSNNQMVCNNCETDPAVWRCETCGPRCDECWPNSLPHKRKSPLHQRVTIDQFNLFRRVLDPDPSNLDTLHRDDDDSLWFSVDGDTGSLELRDCPRFGAILTEHQRQHSPQSPPYPHLVSFIGKTGEGKSAIIRLLIEHLWDETARRRTTTLGLSTKAPVVGPRQRSIPTSGDVHLYYDVLMNDDEAIGRPLLYADCEGFGAGTQKSTSHQGRRSDKEFSSSLPGLHGIPKWKDDWTPRYIKNWFSRPLPGVQKRQDAVRYLFPKLLYNFSDVVVNVMQSHSLRQIDDSISDLLEWAEVSHASATNRFGLPHLIIVLNRSDDESDWDPIATAQQILNEQQGILEGNHKVKAIADKFRAVGVPINTLKDLLLTSYASVQFIRLPDGKFVFCLSTQLGRLQEMIYRSSHQSLDEKLDRRMLLPGPHMDKFFRLAFDHFSNKVNEPFDFLAQLISLRPPPAKMAARLSEMMITTFKTLDTEADPNSIAPRFCSVVIPLVCSIVALDAARSSFPGKWVNIFCGETDQSARGFWGSNKNSYKLQIAEAFDIFTSMTLKCKYRGASGEPCVNRYASHQYHQNHKGAVLGPGPYESHLLDELVIQWENSLYSGLNALDNEIDSQDTRQARRNATWRMHREAIEGLYSAVQTFENTDLTICSWCFCNDSSEFLACGHGICNACLAEIAIPSGMDQRLKVVDSCSLHTTQRLFEPPLLFFQLPAQIGRRILSLDGDSGHGVFQTTILKDVENHFGGEIPIRHFFDLIGGSGTGGLLAIGIGIGNWVLDKPAAHMLSLQPNIMGWRHPRAIIKAFGEDTTTKRIIGSRAHASESPKRVFVTATLVQISAEIEGLTIMTNYMRPEWQEPRTFSYEYEAGHRAEQNFTIHDAAKATSQAPTSPYPLSRRGVEYFDGGVCCNNPANIAIAEAQTMWPPEENTVPHFLLSVGNGCVQGDEDDSKDDLNTHISWIDRISNFFTEQSTKELMELMEINRRSGKSWDIAFTPNSGMHPTRCVRLDTRKSENETPENIAEKYLAQEHSQREISKVCHVLLATTFYFNGTERHHQIGNELSVIEGEILCRFPQGSDTTKSLGRVLERLSNPRIELITPRHKEWNFSQDTISRMKEEGVCSIPVDFEVPRSEGDINLVFITADQKGEPIGASILPSDL